MKKTLALFLLLSCAGAPGANDVTLGQSLEGDPTDVVQAAGDGDVLATAPFDPATSLRSGWSLDQPVSTDPDVWVGPFLTGYGSTFAANTPILLRAPVGPKVGWCALSGKLFTAAFKPQQQLTGVTVAGGFATAFLPYAPPGAYTVRFYCDDISANAAPGQAYNDPLLVQIGGGSPQLSDIQYAPDNLLLYGETYTFSATVQTGGAPIGHCWSVYQTPGLYSVQAPAIYDPTTGKASVVIANYPGIERITFACVDHAQGIGSTSRTMPLPSVDAVLQQVDREAPTLKWDPILQQPFTFVTNGTAYLYAPFTDNISPNVCTIAVGPVATPSEYRFFTLPAGGARVGLTGGDLVGLTGLGVQNEPLVGPGKLSYGRWSAFFTCSDSVRNQGVYGPVEFDYNAP